MKKLIFITALMVSISFSEIVFAQYHNKFDEEQDKLNASRDAETRRFNKAHEKLVEETARANKEAEQKQEQYNRDNEMADLKRRVEELERNKQQ